MTKIDEFVKELIAIGASVGAHCQPCLEYHIQAATELGVEPDDICQAISVGHTVEKGAMAAMKKIRIAAVEKLTDTASQDHLAVSQPSAASKEDETDKFLIIYDPAMCCSSGVCGSSVDAVLAQFAGTLKFLSEQTGIHIERYNLGQEPQAFVDDPQVKSLLADEKQLPFIFVNNQLYFQGEYPPRDELLQALGIKPGVDLFPGPEAQADTLCCGEKGCC